MKIIVDAFGGDNAPKAMIEGCMMAVKEYGASILLCGDEEKIKACAKEHNFSLHNIEIVHSPGVMDVHTDPTEILKSDTSMAEGLRRLAKGEGDAFVSAGSTGALLVGGTLIVKRIKGIKRPALSPVMPTADKPYLLIDCGANLDVRPEMLVQFGIMGSVYMNKVLGCETPRVGLLNVGAEDTKGGEMLVETYGLLKNSPVNFVGNIEAREVPEGACDVLVTDGFSGNIVLKLTEGVAGSFMGMIKKIFKRNWITKFAAMLIMPGLKALKKQMDYTEYGGAPLLGTARPVIKAHGSSNAKAFKNAIRQAIQFSETGVIEEIEAIVNTK
ncbi:MAG: phosphate--acyl-ACP acyltransferase [Clostridiales bacterium 43-6]|nr:MAG: phosphate--acyl-ACP acyltransferase [Clostridiales bacterium 43-6]